MNSAFLTALPLRTVISTRPAITTKPSLTTRLSKSARMTISPPESETTTKQKKHPIPSAFDWRNQWYPLIWTHDITTKPHSFTIFGKPLVLFRDHITGDIIVLDDVCPHRAAPLSSGMLTQTETGTQILCGYHGWRFDAKGNCTDIPYAERVPKSACMERVYPTAQWNHLVFVWFGEKPADESLLPVPDKFRTWGDNVIWFRNTRRTLPVSFIGAVENVLDPAHVNWVHHGTGQGHRSRIPRDAGIDTEWTDDGKLISNVITGNGNMGYRLQLTHQPPSSVFYNAPFGFLLFIWHRPISYDECEIYVLNGFVNPKWRMKLESMIMPRWRECSIVNMILDGDSVIMHKQMMELQRRNRDGLGRTWKDKYLLANGKWDTAVKQFQEFIDINAVGMPWESKINISFPTRSVRDVNDRLTVHTKDCAACSGALKWANRLLGTAIVGMALGAVMLVSTVLVNGCGLRSGNLVRASVFGMVLCILSGILGIMMMRVRKSLCYTTKAYDLAH